MPKGSVVIRYLNHLLRAKARKLMPNINSGNINTMTGAGENQALPGDITTTLALIRSRLGHSIDLMIREFTLSQTRGAVVCLDGMVDKRNVDSHILQPLLISSRLANPTPVTGAKKWQWIKDHTLTALDFQETDNLDTALEKILSGYTGLFLDGLPKALLIDTVSFPTRGVQEPENESVVRGPREGFNESLLTNIILIRRKIKSPDLRIEKMTLGRVTKTDICLVYIQGIVNPALVAETKKRLARIQLDSILESGYLEAFIQDAPYSLFATIGNTEKPDIAAAKMLEGRLVLLVDGTPIALTFPYVFIEALQSSEDYYSRWPSGTLLRWLRIISLALTTLLPALYVATTAYNPEVLPTVLFITIAASREGVPLPTVAEMIFMGIVFEILREAGIRQPRPVGQAVSIIGALVIGQAAISSGLVSAPAVMVTVLTGITSFVIPAQSVTYVYIRIFWLLLAAVLGFFGLLLGIMAVLTHLASLRSFGVPYLTPLGPAHFKNWTDFIVRAPLWVLDRNTVTATQPKDQKPSPLAGAPGPPDKGGQGHD